MKRLTPSGPEVTPFPVGGAPGALVKAFGEDSAGNLLLGGDFTTIAGQTKNRLVRLDSTGIYDSNFDVGAGFNNSVNDIAVASSG
ncbi:delta-60 repeat domain-containing protein, partial [Escherichia ruysiae]|uniref:delta-60 repeat domain-containing protein n=1 Tax=Escherichia ruysiae TaxID=2608867 RepID=UPI00215AF798